MLQSGDAKEIVGRINFPSREMILTSRSLLDVMMNIIAELWRCGITLQLFDWPRRPAIGFDQDAVLIESQEEGLISYSGCLAIQFATSTMILFSSCVV